MYDTQFSGFVPQMRQLGRGAAQVCGRDLERSASCWAHVPLVQGSLPLDLRPQHPLPSAHPSITPLPRPAQIQVIHDHWTGGHRLPGVHPGPPPSCQSPAGCCYRGWGGGVPWGRANDHTWDVTNRVIQYEPPQRETDTWSLTPQVPWHSPVGKGFCRRVHGSSVGPLPVLDWPVLQSAAQTSGQRSALGVKMYPPKFTC